MKEFPEIIKQYTLDDSQVKLTLTQQPCGTVVVDLDGHIMDIDMTANGKATIRALGFPTELPKEPDPVVSHGLAHRYS